MDTPVAGNRQLSLVLAGGGARAAYQAGVLEYIQEAFPKVTFPIITGVSAGAINAAYMAGHAHTSGASGMAECWKEITRKDVFVMEPALSMIRRLLRKTKTGATVDKGESLLDASPLRAYLADNLPATENGELPRIREAIAQGSLNALCITTTSFATGQSVSWIQGRDIDAWQRPNRVAIKTELVLDHIMASTALPLLFAAVKLGNSWYGDGSIRLTTPLAPALHLGATDILVISTRYDRSLEEASVPAIRDYPPAAQIMGVMLNAIFLDTLDHDARNLRNISNLVQQLPEAQRRGFRPVNCLVLQPSMDLGRLASGFDTGARGVMRLLMRGLGSSETESPDLMSVLLFESAYISRVIELGFDDARNQHNRIEAFLKDGTVVGEV